MTISVSCCAVGRNYVDTKTTISRYDKLSNSETEI